MKLTAWHRLFVYGVTITLLVGYMATKDANLFSVFTHTLPGVLGLEAGNALGTAKQL
jgi:hypothetical protein